MNQQFYIGYPLILLGVQKLNRKALIPFFLISVALSFGLSLWGVYRYPGATFFLLPTRAWELLLGGLLCVLPTAPALLKRIPATICGVIGLILIFWASVTLDAESRFPGMNAMSPCAGACLIIYSGSSRLSLISTILSFRPIVFIGLISYSLYLWHWPILVMLNHMAAGTEPSTSSRLMALSVSLILSVLSWWGIETPFRDRSILPRTHHLLAAVAVCSLVIVVCSLMIANSRGLADRFSPQVLSYANARNSFAFVNEVDTKGVLRSELPTFGDTAGTSRCLVWGDSHATSLVAGLDRACQLAGVAGYQATHSTTPPLVDFVYRSRFGLNEECDDFAIAVIDYCMQNDVQIVILAGMWKLYIDEPGFAESLTKTVKILNEMGVQVAFVRDVAKQSFDVPIRLSMAARFGEDVSKLGVNKQSFWASNQAVDLALDAISKQGLSVTILDPAEFLVDDKGVWRCEFGGVSMYRDSDHLSIEGSLRLQPMFERFLNTAIQ